MTVRENGSKRKCRQRRRLVSSRCQLRATSTTQQSRPARRRRTSNISDAIIFCNQEFSLNVSRSFSSTTAKLWHFMRGIKSYLSSVFRLFGRHLAVDNVLTTAYCVARFAQALSDLQMIAFWQRTTKLKDENSTSHRRTRKLRRCASSRGRTQQRLEHSLLSPHHFPLVEHAAHERGDDNAREEAEQRDEQRRHLSRVLRQRDDILF